MIALVHGTGCGIAAKGEGFDALDAHAMGIRRQSQHWRGVLMVGLGCEVFQIGRMKEEYGVIESEAFHSLTIQATGGTRKTVDGRRRARPRHAAAARSRAKRETAPASELMLALQCGGSDGYSGITANPALGAAADILVRNGGTAILSETPEIYGAEHLLTRRAATPEIGQKLVERIHWWEDYSARNGGEMNNNPSPGNKAGGLTTILEKSLGAAAKGGTTALNGVYDYAEPVTAKGFVFMDTPGYDPVSATGQVAGGANVLAFTTGRGSAYGCKPTPSIKLATNNDIYRRMIEDMDINCGDVRRRRVDRREGQGDFRQDPCGRLGRTDQVGDAGLWRRGIHALADRGDDVIGGGGCRRRKTRACGLRRRARFAYCAQVVSCAPRPRDG